MSGLRARAERLVRRARAVLAHREPGTGRTTAPARPTARPVADGVVIQYSPRLDGDPDPGEVVWTWVPFEEDPSMGKDRPVVIVGRRGPMLSGVALSTKHHEGAVEVGTGSWDPRQRPSYAKVARLIDIDAGAVRREGAILSRRRFDAVVEGVGRHHHVQR